MRNTSPLLVELLASKTTFEINLAFSEKIGNRSTKTQLYYYWAYTQKMPQHIKRTHAMFIAVFAAEVGNNPDVLKGRNGYRKCGTSTQWSTTQLSKTMTS
uniref:Uncharacterized protein n=1 Tax=uncultured prokaryote TaxID=198431 RepID=A0A0H5Q6E2_9ZZZZ|nr:hypothetical protein [uncultured prokaryote]